MSATVNVPVTGAWGPHKLFPLLTEYVDPDGAKWLYASASTDITQYSAVGVNSSGVAVALTKARADAGDKIGVVQVAVDGAPDAAYGWVKMTGTVVVRTGAGVVPGALYTSGTAGVVDDASTGQTRLYGLFATATGTGTGAGSAGIIQNNILT